MIAQYMNLHSIKRASAAVICTKFQFLFYFENKYFVVYRIGRTRLSEWVFWDYAIFFSVGKNRKIHLLHLNDCCMS